MLDLVFHFFSTYLIEVMSALLVVGLFFRWAGHRQSKVEDAYFTSFTSEIEKVLLQQKEQNQPHRHRHQLPLPKHLHQHHKGLHRGRVSKVHVCRAMCL